MIQPEVLSSGYLVFRFGPGRFFQVPPQFAEETVPDEFIFQPEWNRKAANLAWADYRKMLEGK